MVYETRLEREAIKLAGKPDWHPYNFVKIHGGVSITGVQCPLITRGRNKGQPNFRKPVPGSRLTVFVPSASEPSAAQTKSEG